MTDRKEISVIMISHKFREVTAYCDSLTVLRRGKRVGGGKVSEMTTAEMAHLMIGDTQIKERATRIDRPAGETVLDLAGLMADGEEGLPVLNAVNLKVKAGEIVGIAGVSGNGQSQLVEVLLRQRHRCVGAQRRPLFAREPAERGNFLDELFHDQSFGREAFSTMPLTPWRRASSAMTSDTLTSEAASRTSR